MRGLLVVLTVLVVIVVLVAMVRGNRPWQGNTTAGDEPRDTENDRLYRGTDVPAGPDAEDPPAPPTPSAPG